MPFYVEVSTNHTMQKMPIDEAEVYGISIAMPHHPHHRSFVLL
jgi:hypothetical protein